MVTAMRTNLPYTTIALIVAMMSYQVHLKAQPGTNDPTFNPTDLGFGNGDGFRGNEVTTQVVQPDGKIIVGGDVSSFNGQGPGYLFRLNANGSLDTSFDVGTGPSGWVSSIALRTNGQIIVAGAFNAYDGFGVPGLVQLNTDGSRDMTFSPSIPSDHMTLTVLVQPDGKVITSGSRIGTDGLAHIWMERFNTDGSTDATFVMPIGEPLEEVIMDMYLAADGSLLIGGRFTSLNGILRSNIARLHADGSLDLSFDPGMGSNDVVDALAVQPDGEVLVGGHFTEFDGTPMNRLVRLFPDGTVDPSFTIGTGVTTSSLPIDVSSVNHLGLRPDGRILVGGEFTEYDGMPSGGLVQLLANGSMDPAFEVGLGFQEQSYVYTFHILPNEQVLVGGYFRRYRSQGVSADLVRLNADASLDETFNAGTGANGPVRASLVQPDGKILIAGDFTRYNNVPRNHIARLNNDGSVDLSFDPGSGLQPSVLESPMYLALRTDGKVLVSGGFDAFDGVPVAQVVRLNPDGSHDPAFTGVLGGGPLLIQPDEKSLVGPHRLNSDGSLDGSFDASWIIADVHAMVLQPDGRIIVGGGTYSNAPGLFARINVDGSMDPTFASGTSFPNGIVTALALRPDGKVWVGGAFTSYGGVTRNNIARVNANGTLDMSFDPGTGFDLELAAMVAQPDGRIITAGLFETYNGVTRKGIARIDANGSLDTSFDPGTGFLNYDASETGQVHALSLHPDGRLIAGGSFTSYNGTGRNRIIRLQGDPVTSCDNWSLELTTDNAGSETTWEIRNAGTTTVVDAGGPYANNTTVNEVVCLIPGACYELIVTDANGMSNGPIGGFVLRDQNGKRVLDNAGDGVFTGISQAVAPFCSPVGNDAILSSQCDKVDWTPNQFLIATPNSAVSAQYGVGNQTDDGYEFRLFNPDGGYDRTVYQSHANTSVGAPAGPNAAAHLNYSALVTNPVPQNVLLNVRVRSRVNGVFSAWGPACRFKIDAVAANCPAVQLVSTPGSQFSCGATNKIVGNSGPDGRIVSTQASRVIGGVSQQANRYQFDITTTGGYSRTIVATTRTLVLGQWYTNPLLCGFNTYSVRVRASFDGGATWCPYGATCSVGITNNLAAPFCTSAPAFAGGDDRVFFDGDETSSVATLSMWPNPNRGDQLYLTIDQLNADVTTATVDIFDLYGKKVTSRTIAINGSTLNTVINLDGTIASGMYLVNLTAGEQTFVQRLVIQ